MQVVLTTSFLARLASWEWFPVLWVVVVAKVVVRLIDNQCQRYTWRQPLVDELHFKRIKRTHERPLHSCSGLRPQHQLFNGDGVFGVETLVEVEGYSPGVGTIWFDGSCSHEPRSQLLVRPNWIRRGP